MPMKPERYPPDWKAISARIRERAGNRCEQCGVENGALIMRQALGKLVKIVLTVAHLDHDTTHNTDDNLACLCQRCHLNYDRAHNLRAIAARRARQRGQLEMRMTYVRGNGSAEQRNIRVVEIKGASAARIRKADRGDATRSFHDLPRGPLSHFGRN